MLTLGQHGQHHSGSSPASQRRAEAASRSASMQGRRSGEIMGIAEEEEDDEDDVEEVDEFSPVIGGVEEVVDEREDGDTDTGVEKVPGKLEGELKGLGLGDGGRGLLLNRLMEVREESPAPREPPKTPEKGKENEKPETPPKD